MMQVVYQILALLTILPALVYSVPCTFVHGNQRVTYGTRNGAVHFRFVLTGVPPGSIGWTGIGFGHSMSSGLDSIIIRLMNNRVIITDEYVRGYQSPLPDQINNVQVSSTSYQNGIIEASFSRAIHATEQPNDMSLSGCQPWKFVIGLNPMTPQGNIFHHISTPIHQVVCLEHCTL